MRLHRDQASLLVIERATARAPCTNTLHETIPYMEYLYCISYYGIHLVCEDDSADQTVSGDRPQRGRCYGGDREWFEC